MALKLQIISIFLVISIYKTLGDSNTPNLQPQETDPKLSPELVEWMKRLQTQYKQDIGDLKQLVINQNKKIMALSDQNSKHQSEIAELKNQREIQREEMEIFRGQIEELRKGENAQRTRIQQLQKIIVQSETKNQQVQDKKICNTETGWLRTENNTAAQTKRSDDSNAWEPVLNQISNQMTQVTAQIHALQNSDQARGSVYTRWGNDGCPTTSSLVYSGVMGGSHYTQPGGAANYLCLPHDPHIDNTHVPSQTAHAAEIFGSEYEPHDSRHDLNALCAVCHSPRSSSLVLPAKVVCPAGWTKEYQGHIMAGAADHAAPSEFICVDDERDFTEGTSQNQDGKLLYYAVTHCGSLPCPAYLNSKLVPCVVCSQ